MSAPANRAAALKTGEITPECVAIAGISSRISVKLRYLRITASLLDLVVS